MKKFISLLTMIAVLFSICVVNPITASAVPVDAWGEFGALTGTLPDTKFTSYSEFEAFKNEYSGRILFDIAAYDEGFFENYNLYLLTVNENDSGSSIYDVLKINYGADSIDIEVTKTQQGVTDDVVSWLYIYALDKNYPQDKINLIYTEDLSRHLDSLFFGEYRFTEADKAEGYSGCYIAKADEYADIEKYSWASKYDESFFENNFLLAVRWYEGIASNPPIYSIGSLKRSNNNVEIEIRQDRYVECGPAVVCTYICIIELPKDMYNMEYSLFFNDWIMLYDENDIKKFADDVNGGNTYEGKTVVLCNDIDLSGICGADINGGEISWTPIGADNGPTDSMPNIFNGTFDGNGHTISGLYINSSYGDYIGLFGHTGDKAIINNLTVDGYVGTDTDTNKSCYAGAISGRNEGVIESCHNKAAVSVSGGVIAGGIAGNNGGTIRKCSNSGAVSTDKYLVGGICGRNFGIIENSYNTGTVSGDLLIGGVCAQVLSGSIYNCYNIGK